MRQDLERERAELGARCEALLNTKRQQSDSDAKARSRLRASERQALDHMRKRCGELDTLLEGEVPEPPWSR